MGFEPAEKLWGVFEGLWDWAGLLFSQLRPPTKMTVLKGFTTAQHRSVKEQKLLFLLVKLAETVCTQYGKRSVSAAGNGSFREETERM